jgi:hypothetical protein
LRTIEKCNILKGVCPELKSEYNESEYSIIYSENGKHFTIRKIKINSGSIDYSVMGENETYIISNTKNEHLKKSSIKGSPIPSQIFNRFNLNQKIINNSKAEINEAFRNHQIYQDTSYNYFVVLNKSKKVKTQDNKQLSVYTWYDFKNKMISEYIADKLISDTISIINQEQILKDIETSVIKSYTAENNSYNCLITGKTIPKFK